MKVLLINSVCGIKSTGRICTDLAQILEKSGHECKVAYGREQVPENVEKFGFKFTDDTSVKLDALKTRLTDNAGFNSKKATARLIKWIKEYAPDIIHLHNIHGYYINISMLFKFLKEYSKPVVWTLHDCWAFTGHCAHFSLAGCDRWKTGCFNCIQKSAYPSSLFLDMSVRNFKAKKELFTSLENLTIVTPSKWLADTAKQSFLGKYNIIPIPNGVDLELFKKSESNFRKDHGLEGKKIILGAATAWTESKGIYEFSRLAEIVPEGYKVVLVGVNKEQWQQKLSSKLLLIEKTNSIQQMAEIYSASDVFINASREETMGLTTVEAMACGTPAIASPYTAVPEVIQTCGGIVTDDISAKGLLDAVNLMFSKEYPQTRENAKLYEKNQQYQKYIDIYNKIYTEN